MPPLLILATALSGCLEDVEPDIFKTPDASVPPPDGGQVNEQPAPDAAAIGQETVLPPSTACTGQATGADEQAAAAIDRTNAYRSATGIGCIQHVDEIALAALNHCRYVVANTGACIANAHYQVQGCDLFTGETFVDRMKAAGFEGRAAFEVMAYVSDGKRAVDLWMDSVWHRLPLMDPGVAKAGYGTEKECDTMDFAYSAGAPSEEIVRYPYDGQTGVPTAFAGNERPEPPRPPGGWPSGYPVSLFAPDLKQVSYHGITVDGSEEDLDHVFLGPDDPAAQGLLVHEFFLYTHAPLAEKTRYRVTIAGTDTQDRSVVHQWHFTTR